MKNVMNVILKINASESEMFILYGLRAPLLQRILDIGDENLFDMKNQIICISCFLDCGRNGGIN